MKPIAAMAAMARLAASLATTLASTLASMALLAAPAQAGDAAQFNPLGFSADGRYFAFEAYGIQDGSGFPYASLTILDVAEDKWAAGSPFDVRMEDDTATMADARDAVRAEAEAQLDALELTTPALTVALNGDGEPAGDGSLLSFGKPGYGLDALQDPATLSLTTTLPDYTGPCTTDYGFDPPVGYVLTLETSTGSTELHADQAIPASRGCTVAYRLYGVFAPLEWAYKGLTPVAVLSVYTHGFEGPDRRFIAVPVTGYP
jgi:predicted secreted protein